MKKEKIGNLKAQSRDFYIDTLGDSEREKKMKRRKQRNKVGMSLVMEVCELPHW